MLKFEIKMNLEASKGLKTLNQPDKHHAGS